MTIEELRNSLLAAPKNGYARLTPAQREEMEAHARGYAAFIDACRPSVRPLRGLWSC